MRNHWNLIAFFFSLLISFSGCKDGVEYGDVWHLPNGDQLTFYHDRSNPWQSDHAKVLQVSDSSGKVEHIFEFGKSHSGYNHVDLHINADETVVWLVDSRSGRIGAGLTIEDYSFESIDEMSMYQRKDAGIEIFGKVYKSAYIVPINKKVRVSPR